MTSQAEFLLAEQLRRAGIPFEAEYRFHPERKWRFDFALPDRLIGVEVEGGTWAQGRHTRGKGYEDDLAKYNAAAVDGWLVLRFTTSMVEREIALDYITRLSALQSVWLRTDRRSGCWLWESANKHGYAYGRFKGKVLPIHRIVYTNAYGDPGDLDVDHICHNKDESCRGGDDCRHRRCTNPLHLEAVTRSENVKRGRMGGRGVGQECKRGHGPLEEATWPGRTFRFCRTCKNENNRRYAARKRAKEDAAA